MGTSDNGQEVLRQNLEEKGTFQALYQMHLLFREKGKRPEGKKILGRLQKEFGQVDLVADIEIRRGLVEHDTKKIKRLFRLRY